MTDRLPVPAFTDEPSPVLGVRGLCRCTALGFTADGDNVSLLVSKSSLLPNHKISHIVSLAFICRHESVTNVHVAVCVTQLQLYLKIGKYVNAGLKMYKT